MTPDQLCFTRVAAIASQAAALSAGRLLEIAPEVCLPFRDAPIIAATYGD